MNYSAPISTKHHQIKKFDFNTLDAKHSTVTSIQNEQPSLQWNHKKTVGEVKMLPQQSRLFKSTTSQDLQYHHDQLQNLISSRQQDLKQIIQRTDDGKEMDIIMEAYNQQAKYQILHRGLERKKPQNIAPNDLRSRSGDNMIQAKQMFTNMQPQQKESRQIINSNLVFFNEESCSSNSNGPQIYPQARILDESDDCIDDVADEYCIIPSKPLIDSKQFKNDQKLKEVKQAIAQAKIGQIKNELSKQMHKLSQISRDTHRIDAKALTLSQLKRSTSPPLGGLLHLTTGFLQQRTVTPSQAPVQMSPSLENIMRPPLSRSNNVLVLQSVEREDNNFNSSNRRKKLSITQFVATNGTTLPTHQTPKVDTQTGYKFANNRSSFVSLAMLSQSSAGRISKISNKNKGMNNFQSQELVDRLMAHEAQKQSDLERLRQLKQIEEENELFGLQKMHKSNVNPQKCFSRLVQDVNQRNQKLNNAQLKKSQDLEKELSGYFKPKLISKTSTSISHYSQRSQSSRGAQNQQFPQPQFTPILPYNKNRNNDHEQLYLYRSHDLMMKPQVEQVTPQFEKVYLTPHTNVSQGVAKLSIEDKLARISEIRKELRERHKVK